LCVVFSCQTLQTSFAESGLPHIFVLIKTGQGLLFSAANTERPEGHNAFSVNQMPNHFFYAPFAFRILVNGLFGTQVSDERIGILPLLNKLLDNILFGYKINVALVVLIVFGGLGMVFIPV